MVPASLSVQQAKPTLPTGLTSLLSMFCTEFSTGVLKTPGEYHRQSLYSMGETRKAAIRRPENGLSYPTITRNLELACDFLEQFLINIEVCVYVLHVVMLLERFHQTNHRGRG